MSNSELRDTIRAQVERSILQIAERSGTVTADDVRREVVIPAQLDPRIVGPAFRSLQLGGLIVEIGDQHTDRPIAHSRMIRVWRLSGDLKKVATRLAESTPDLPTKQMQLRLFEEIYEPYQTIAVDAGETMAVVPPAFETSVTPEKE